MLAHDETPPWRVFDGSDRRAPPAANSGGGPDSAPRRGTDRSEWFLVAIGAGFIALAVAAFSLLGASEPSVAVAVDGGDPTDVVSSAATEEIVVAVSGAVARPGVVRLPKGSRIADAIAAAGGFGPRVDATRVERELNLAARLNDGEHVHVPSRDDPPESAAATGSSGSRESPDGPLDLNAATAAELEALPGIGPVTAAKILAAREEAAFRSVDELRTRKLVGPATFEKIRDLVTVR